MNRDIMMRMFFATFVARITAWRRKWGKKKGVEKEKCTTIVLYQEPERIGDLVRRWFRTKIAITIPKQPQAEQSTSPPPPQPQGETGEQPDTDFTDAEEVSDVDWRWVEVEPEECATATQSPPSKTDDDEEEEEEEEERGVDWRWVEQIVILSALLICGGVLYFMILNILKSESDDYSTAWKVLKITAWVLLGAIPIVGVTLLLSRFVKPLPKLQFNRITTFLNTVATILTVTALGFFCHSFYKEAAGQAIAQGSSVWQEAGNVYLQYDWQHLGEHYPKSVHYGKVVSVMLSIIVGFWLLSRIVGGGSRGVGFWRTLGSLGSVRMPRPIGATLLILFGMALFHLFTWWFWPGEWWTLPAESWWTRDGWMRQPYLELFLVLYFGIFMVLFLLGSSNKYGRWMGALLAIIIVAGAFSNWPRTERTTKQEIVVKAPPTSSGTWRLHYRLPNGKVSSHKVQIIRDDLEVMEFKSESNFGGILAHYIWYKREEFGRWWSEGNNVGREYSEGFWYLRPDEQGGYKGSTWQQGQDPREMMMTREKMGR